MNGRNTESIVVGIIGDGGGGVVQSSKPDKIQTEICNYSIFYKFVILLNISKRLSIFSSFFLSIETLQHKPQQTMCVSFFPLSPKLMIR